TRSKRDWSSDVCSSDLETAVIELFRKGEGHSVFIEVAVEQAPTEPLVRGGHQQFVSFAAQLPVLSVDTVGPQGCLADVAKFQVEFGGVGLKVHAGDAGCISG